RFRCALRFGRTVAAPGCQQSDDAETADCTYVAPCLTLLHSDALPGSFWVRRGRHELPTLQHACVAYTSRPSCSRISIASFWNSSLPRILYARGRGREMSTTRDSLPGRGVSTATRSA